MKFDTYCGNKTESKKKKLDKNYGNRTENTEPKSVV